ncbi:hypothetical protein SAMN02910297_01461 [Methanobrevibacter olleyae]|uniref:Uncharacterized protein n=1 Tax=Methanobrevibacter olleyae TaxID=294671 RepID=A0A1I4JJL4_METOL|nr:hypothetical protein [Methanobrevibacter olleyae]SFL66762.1 hypothetical protein SAMN02910297_01461 [Methanobrevibacter olleyae]
MIEKKVPQKTIERDKLLLDLMIHAYDEDVARNELVDSKNCQMIVLTGVMLTLQATFFTELLVNSVLLKDVICYDRKVILSVLMLISMILYVCSLFIFINAYAFNKKFGSSPDPEELLDKAIDNHSIKKVQGNVLFDFNETISYNSSIIDDKINKGKFGFITLGVGGISTLLFLLVFILYLI